MKDKVWFTINMQVKPLKDTEYACLIKVQGISKFRGWVVWLPKGCIKDRRTIVLHKSMTLTLFIPTKHKHEQREEHELTAKELYQLTTNDYSDEDL